MELTEGMASRWEGALAAAVWPRVGYSRPPCTHHYDPSAIRPERRPDVDVISDGSTEVARPCHPGGPVRSLTPLQLGRRSIQGVT